MGGGEGRTQHAAARRTDARAGPLAPRPPGEALGIDFNEVNAEEFRLGLSVELEHGRADPRTNVTDDDIMTTGKIAWTRLREFPDYYTQLAKLEAEADQYWSARR